MSARDLIALLVLVTPIAVPLALAESGPPAARKSVDFEAAFAEGFPAVAAEHHVADWKLYAALVDGDVIAYAARIDAAVGHRLEAARGKGYQMQQVEAAIKQNKPLRAAFDDQRRRLRTMLLYSDGGESGLCRRSVVYVGDEFRLVLGARARGADPLASATVAPSCAESGDAHFQLTAGQSTRFKCWTSVNETSCGWRLPDMPDSLKQVIEDQYPGAIKLRWHWRGLGGVSRVRFLDSNGNRVGEAQATDVTTPLELGLEFVDAAGRVLWTAPSTAPSRR
ncbi:MAG: hypothetical protein JWM53_1054 [bacterium]|nr:hypothetical protein [bacterium]